MQLEHCECRGRDNVRKSGVERPFKTLWVIVSIMDFILIGRVIGSFLAEN